MLVFSSLAKCLPLSSEILATAAGAVITTGAGDDTILASDGDDTISSGAGNDLIKAGSGDDLITAGPGGDRVFGGDGNDTIIVNAGDIAPGDLINGDLGQDVLLVGTSAAGPIAIDLTAARLLGIEEIEFSEAADVAKTLTITGPQIKGISLVNGNLGAADTLSIVMATARNINLSALAFADWNTAAPENDRVLITGDADAESYLGSSQRDEISAGGGNDKIDGGGGNDVLDGGAGNDSIIDDSGSDTMEGGNGNDTISDSGIAALGIDSLDGGDGIDWLRVGPVTGLYVLDLTTGVSNIGDTAVNFENVVTGFIGFSLDSVTGTVGDNIIITNEGSDTIRAGGGNDRVDAGNGDDLIDGGSGVDTLLGGFGDDVYIVDAAGEAVELPGLGTDTVQSSVSYVLGANIETLILTGTGNIDAAGNALANLITGNDGNNFLIANGGGADTLQGGLGDDIYRVGAADTVIELGGQGTDTVLTSQNGSLDANLEILILEGVANISGTGNDLDNRLIGNSGNNTLTGGLGRDILTGGTGTDRFDFNALTESGTAGATRDRVTDFDAGTAVTTVDRIDLATIDANELVAGNQAFSGVIVASGNPFTAAGQIRATQSGANTLIEINTDADLAAEMAIQLTGVTATNINGGDFIL